MPHRALVAIFLCQLFPVLLSSVLGPSLLLSQSSETCGRTAEFKPNTIIVHRRAMNIGGGFLKRFIVSSLDECYFTCCSVTTCTGAVFKSRSSKECFLFNCIGDDDCTYEPRAMYDVLLLSRTTALHQVEVGEACGPTKTCQTNHSVCSDGRCDCQLGYLRKDSVCVRSVCQSPQLQFQCADSSTCVAIYDKCNGIVECPDGSDEIGCPSTFDAMVRRSYVQSDLLRDTNGVGHSHEQINSPPRFTTVRNFGRPSRSTLRAHKTPSHLQAHPKVHDLWDTKDEWRDPVLMEEISEKSSNVNANSGNLRDLSFFNKKIPRSRSFRDQASIPDLNFDADTLEQSDSWIPSPHRSGHTIHSSAADKPLHRSSFPSIYTRNNGVLSHNSDESLFSRIRNPIRNSISEFWAPNLESYSEPDLDDDTFPSHHLSSDRPRTKELIDPSVFKIFRPQERDLSSTSPALHELTSPPKEAASGSIQPKSNSPSDTMVGRNHSESHVSALILAFGLGLVCCFVVLLILEWRRRRHTSTWAMRRRPANLPVLFNERRKPAAMQLHPNRRSKTAIRAMSNPTGSDEENEALCDGLVL